MRRMTGPVLRVDPRSVELTIAILDTPRRRPGLTSEDIADATGFTYDHVRGVMLRLYAREMVDRRERDRRGHHGKTPFEYGASQTGLRWLAENGGVAYANAQGTTGAAAD